MKTLAAFLIGILLALTLLWALSQDPGPTPAEVQKYAECLSTHEYGTQAYIDCDKLPH